MNKILILFVSILITGCDAWFGSHGAGVSVGSIDSAPTSIPVDHKKSIQSTKTQTAKVEK